MLHQRLWTKENSLMNSDNNINQLLLVDVKMRDRRFSDRATTEHIHKQVSFANTASGTIQGAFKGVQIVCLITNFQSTAATTKAHLEAFTQLGAYDCPTDKKQQKPASVPTHYFNRKSHQRRCVKTLILARLQPFHNHNRLLPVALFEVC